MSARAGSRPSRGVRTGPTPAARTAVLLAVALAVMLLAIGPTPPAAAAPNGSGDIGAGPSPATFTPQSVPPIEAFLYVSADRIRRFSGPTLTSSTVAEAAPGQFFGQPHLAFQDQGWAWRGQSWSAAASWLTYTETVSAGGSQTAHTVSNDLAWEPRVSPDGSRLLYAAERTDPVQGLVTDIMVYDSVLDTTVTEIPLADMADWAPDGQRIVYVSYPNARNDPQGVMLYVWDVNTNTSTKVPTAKLLTIGEPNIYSPRWSPSGTRIAFQRVDFTANTVQIVLTDPAGTVENVVADLPLETTGHTMGWLRIGPAEHLFVETVVPGGGPFRLEEVPTTPGPLLDPLVHAAFSWMPPADFVDVGLTAPSAEAIYDLSAFGVIGGYDDGTFRPGNPVLRAQYAKMITIALAIHDAPWTNWNNASFSDVPQPAVQDDSARYPFDFVEEASAANLVKGYSTGEFKPWNAITRVQLALMIARAGVGELTPPSAASLSAFTDVAGLSAEAKQAIALCYENGIIQGKAPGVFDPYANATRNQVALMTWRFMKALGMAE